MPTTPTSDEVLASGSIERERKAELSLLAITHHLPPEERDALLEEFDIPYPEYIRLLEKYSRILDMWEKEKEIT